MAKIFLPIAFLLMLQLVPITVFLGSHSLAKFTDTTQATSVSTLTANAEHQNVWHNNVRRF